MVMNRVNRVQNNRLQKFSQPILFREKIRNKRHYSCKAFVEKTQLINTIILQTFILRVRGWEDAIWTYRGKTAEILFTTV